MLILKHLIEAEDLGEEGQHLDIDPFLSTSPFTVTVHHYDLGEGVEDDPRYPEGEKCEREASGVGDSSGVSVYVGQSASCILSASVMNL
jgi:hypothetical protein